MPRTRVLRGVSLKTRVESGGRTILASVFLPPGPLRGGIVPLHPADNPSRNQFLFRHLADVALPQGIAILSYDRPITTDNLTPTLETQAAIATAALDTLRLQTNDDKVPLGLWGWSQGAWAATLAAARSASVKFMVLIACTGVSPAEQMRYGTAEHLRRAGFGASAIRELRGLRLAWEDSVRGNLAVPAAQKIVERYSNRPWFHLAWVPRDIPKQPSWPDMDFDPRLVFEKIRQPTLLVYGETDEWSPIPKSIRAWREAARKSGNHDVTIRRLPGTGHAPTLGGRHSYTSISPDYTHLLHDWLAAR